MLLSGAPGAGTPGGRMILVCLAAGQQGDECLRVGASPARYRVPSGTGVVTSRDGADDQVGTGSDVVEGLVVAGAAGDAVDGWVNEAEAVMGVLVGQRDESRPQRRGGAGAGGRADPCRAT